MDQREIARLRLRSQLVAGAEPRRPEDVVGWLGAVQSQEYALAKWSVGQRSVGLSDADVEDALQRGAILRTHILRPTWHFVLPADIRWVMRLTAPRVDVQMRHWHQRFGVDEPDLERGLEIVRRELAGGRRQTRRHVAEALVAGGFDIEGQRLAYLFIRAERDLLVASGGGTVRGQQTYALLDERSPLPSAAPAGPDGEAARIELARRYFVSHGPAATGDFTWWSSLTAADTKRAVAALEADRVLERLQVDGVDYWLAPDRIGREEPSPTVHLLQGFDELLVGYRATRPAVNVDGLLPRSVLGRPPFLHLVMLDGQVVGYWRHVPRTGRADEEFAIATRLLRPLSAREHDALAAAVERYSTFVGRAVRLAKRG